MEDLGFGNGTRVERPGQAPCISLREKQGRQDKLRICLSQIASLTSFARNDTISLSCHS